MDEDNDEILKIETPTQRYSSELHRFCDVIISILDRDTDISPRKQEAIVTVVEAIFLFGLSTGWRDYQLWEKDLARSFFKVDKE